MPSWKKVIISGSSAELSSLNAPSITGSLQGTASFASFATSASSVATASFITPLNQNVIVTGSLNVTSNITGSGLLITGSTSGNLVRITQTGAGPAFVVEDSTNPDASNFIIDTSGSVGIGSPLTPSTFSSKLYVGTPEISGWAGIKSNGNNNHAIIGYGSSGKAGIYGENNETSGNNNIGVYGKAYQEGDPFNGVLMIGGKFEAAGDPDYAINYSVQLKDGTQGIGKVLVCQDASGSANWSTQLSGSYALTGSLNMPGNVSPGSSNAKIHVANYPNPPGSLTAGTGSVLYNYGVYNEGLILQYGYSGDQGGIKITDDGVAIFGAGDDDILKVINEDSNTQVFSINDSGYVGINKIGVTSSITPTNAYLDVNGDAIITGSLTVTNNITGSGLLITGSTSGNLVRITQTGTGNAFVVEDSTNPDSSPFLIDTSGNVSIGTTGSSGFVTMKGVGANGVTLDTDGTAGTDFQSTRLFWKISGSGNDISMRNLSGSLLVATQATANGSSGTLVAMFVSKSGNVGIGTTSPSALLHVSASGATNDLRVGNNKLFVSASGNVGIGTTTPNAKLDVSGSAIISGSLTTTSSVAFKAYTSAASFPGTAAGYLAFDSSGNIITVAGAGSAINIGNTDLTITSNAIRTLSHAGTSRFIITGSNAENSILELHSSTTGLGRGLFMTQLINAEPERTAVRATTAGGNNADSITHNGWASDHLVEYVSGSGIAPSQLKGWKWSYFNGSAYKDVLIVSTSNAATISGSLTVTGSISFKGLSSATTSDVVYIDTATGALSYGAGGGGGSAFPYTGSAQITGSLGLTGSLNIYYSGSKNDYPVYITNKTADVAQYINYDVDVAPASNRVASWIQATATGSANSLTGHQIRVITKGASGTALGQDIVAKYDGDTPAGKYAIGMMVVAEGGAYNHALRLIDGSQGAGKVLTCLYNNDGFASWVDPVPAFPYNGDAVVDGTLSVTTGGITGSLQGTASFATSASYAATASYVTGAVAVAAFPYTGSAQITGSLGLTGSLHMPSIEATGVNFAKIHIAKHPQPAGDLPASPGSILYDYGGDSEGLILQYGTGTDEGGIKITDDGVAVFGAGDKDVFKVIDEDLNEQRFSINNAGLVGINKPGVAGVYTPTNAILDVNGDTIITGSLKVTHNLQGDLGTSIDTNALIQSGLLYLSNNF